MPLIEAAASAGHRNAMEGNGWAAMVPSQGSSQCTRKTLKILALDQPNSGRQRIKDNSYVRCGNRAHLAQIPIEEKSSPCRPDLGLRHALAKDRSQPPCDDCAIHRRACSGGFRARLMRNFGSAATRRERG